MSTSFQVYPCNSVIPTIENVISLAKESLEGFILEIGEKRYIDINCEFVKMEGRFAVQGSDFVPFNEKGCLNFIVKDLDYICFLNFREDKYRMKWDERHEHYNLLVKSYDYPYYWNLEGRSILKGFIAGALAMITEGFVYSGDGAWDHKLLPQFGEDFLKTFPRPEKCVSQGLQKWYKENAVVDILNRLSK